MSFRTVVIKNRAKLETRLGWLLIRGEEEKWVHLSEIDTLVIESTACAITTQALCELSKNHANIIFCDEKHLPYGHLLKLYGNHQTSGQVKRQAAWSDMGKNQAWRQIVRQKIYWQQQVLLKNAKDSAATLLGEYLAQVEDGDSTNREGHAAKVYFNALFGQDFGRRTANDINSALNYGYAIILSAVAREIVTAGYITQIGIHHINEFNPHNLASDLMEVFRPLVDAYVLAISDYEDFKSRVSSVLSSKAALEGKEYFLDAAIRLYIRSALSFVDGSEEHMPIVEKFIMEEGNEL